MGSYIFLLEGCTKISKPSKKNFAGTKIGKYLIIVTRYFEQYLKEAASSLIMLHRMDNSMGRS